MQTDATPLDEHWMAQALALAEKAIGLSDPNPRVGCVIVGSQGQLLGSGHTQSVGQPHAEAMALRDAASRGMSTQGSTAYVTLEPCSHHGRTPPCADALVAAGVRRVVASLQDPNPLVSGKGLARLRTAGIEVQCGLMAGPAAALNIGFLKRMATGLPHVRLKWASSLDGRTAHLDGASRWITQAQARLDGQHWRRRAQAILTGIGTVLADDPRLDVRDIPTGVQPLRVVLDRQLRTPVSAKILQAPGQAVLVHAPSLPEARMQGLLACGAELLTLAAPEAPGALVGLLRQLGLRGVNELHVEAGARLNGALLSAGLVDELLIYLAPRLVGPGLGVADLRSSLPLDDAQRWTWLDVQQVGDDLRLRLLRPR
jgi:diaminohydroxyphosphoribosylaminopyrimidine deaminase / 5-amino-6-(5-phosphoribosylamino)uracil reductase